MNRRPFLPKLPRRFWRGFRGFGPQLTARQRYIGQQSMLRWERRAYGTVVTVDLSA